MTSGFPKSKKMLILSTLIYFDFRFPYLAQKNGGGAFLLPYVIMLLVEGLPLFYLELALGQRMQKGFLKIWSDIRPYLKVWKSFL